MSQTPASPRPAPISADPAGFRGRAPERALLFWNLPLVLLAAWGVSTTQPTPGAAFVPALLALGSVWLACFGLHLLLCVTRFNGDLLILPLLSLLLTVASAYHLDLAGPATRGLTPGPYTTAAFAALLILALVTSGGRWFRKLTILFEEKVWWRVAGDRPYYESIPFHFLLLGFMALLAVLLLVGGVRSTGGSLIQVRLPGGLQFTPSELIRLAVAFFLADYLGRNSRIMRNLRQPLGKVWPLNRLYFERRTELMVVLTTVGLYLFFFYAFRDFGPAAVIIVLTLATLYATTGRMLTPLLLGLGIGLMVAIPTWQNLAFGTLRNRGAMWLNPWNTHFVNGDHQARILWSIASGGWYGMGAGAENLPRSLPLARNDAAFAGISAAMGFWVALAVLALFAALTWRGMLAARQAATDRTRLLAFTLTSLLAFQAVWICGAMVRVFPFTGINVPFVSTGLTSMVASALALGTIWNLSRPQNHRSSALDATEATPEVLRGVTRLARPITLSFVLPAVGVILYGCPLLLGDRVLTANARGMARGNVQTTFTNPYLDRFRGNFPRGRVFSADGKLLSISNPTPEEIQSVREYSPEFAAFMERRQETGERFYPLGSSAAQLIGWTTQGKFAAQEGSVETSWDGLLRGYDPRRLPLLFRTRHNPLVPVPKPQDLQLTIDSKVQQFASQRLKTAMQEWKGAGGALLVYDVNSGAVLAAATAPSFDPNNLTLERMTRYVSEHGNTQVLTNKALSSTARYFPGSSFKIVTAAAALTAGITGTVECRNGHNAAPLTWEYEGRRYRREPGRIADYSRGSHGVMDLNGGLEHALAVSCNVFFVRLGVDVGVDRLRDAMKAAGLMQIPEKDELADFLPAAAFGQTVVKTSPVEMAMIAGAAGIARDDTDEVSAARPHWVQALVQNNRRREPEGILGAPNRSLYQPFRPEVARRLREMMLHVVEDADGTANHAFFQGGVPRLTSLRVGGKTGTAEFDKKGKTRQERRGRHAWFVGFARSNELQPRNLAFAVLVEDVKPGGTGGTVCAPVARDVLERIMQSPAEGEGGQDLSRFYPPHRPTAFERLANWLRGLFNRR